MGGDVAIRVAASCPSRVIGLAIVDFAPDIDPAATSHILAEFNADSRAYRSVGSTPRDCGEVSVRFDRAAFAAGGLRAPQAPGRQLSAKAQSRDGGRAGASEADERPALWRLLPRIPCPVLVARR